MENKNFIDIEISEKSESWSMAELHSHSYFELYFLLKGTRRILFSDTLAEVGENSLVVIPPFVMHKTEGGPFLRIVLYVGPERLSNVSYAILMRCHAKSVLPLPKEARAVIEELLTFSDKIGEEAAEARSTLTSYLIYLLGKAEAKCEGAPRGKIVPASVTRAIETIGKSYMKPLTLASLCEQLFVSETALCTGFKKHLGCTVGEYITSLRLTKAKELLFSSGMSLDEVAERVGFSSANYMSLVFKKHIGLAPSKYRAKTKSEKQ